MSIDTDGLRDHCSSCQSVTRATKITGGYIIQCIGCDNAMADPQGSEAEAGWMWNKQERGLDT